MGAGEVRIGVYGDVNLNVIDGSAIWLQSLAQTLHLDDRIDTTLLLKAPEQRTVMTEPLRLLSRLEIADRSALGLRDSVLRPAQALDALERLDDERRFHIVIIRGYPLAKEAARRACFSGRLWVYLTDVPQSVDSMSTNDLSDLKRIAETTRYLVCQTEELRAFLEGVLPEAVGKLILLPPMIPPVEHAPPLPSPSRRLIYAGKFAPLWGFWEMVEIFGKLRARHPGAEFHLVGDKIHNPPDDPTYRRGVERALRTTDGLVWHGGLTRAQVQALLDEGGVAMSVRDKRLDESLELSTKILEYGSAGLPVVLNRTPMHEGLLGASYPLLVCDPAEAVEAIDRIWSDDALYREAATRCREASRMFTFDRALALLKPFIERSAPRADRAHRGTRPLRLLIAGHDFKFFSAIKDHYSAFRTVEVREDQWAGHFEHNAGTSRSLSEWADVIVCEWSLGNAVWYSKHKRPGQRLLVRLHRSELDSEYPDQVTIESVDRVICVGQHYRRQAQARLGWPSGLFSVIPNWVDVPFLDRRKLSDARFTLGILGFVPKRKRLDRAFDILELLRAGDSRWRLVCKGRMPWELSWSRSLQHEREWFEGVFARMERSPLLRDAVSFDPYGADIAAWLRTVGFVLSTSDDESFHLAPAEGMAARSSPVILNWEGSDEIYPERWIHSSTQSAAEAITTLDSEPRWRADGGDARDYVDAHYSLERVLPMWDELVLA